MLDLVAQKLQEPPAKVEQFENFGKHVAEQLRSVSKEQAIYLSKIINDAIFEAQCGTLTRRSHIVTPTEYLVTDQRFLAPEYPRQSDTQGFSNNYQCQPGSATVADYFSNVVP